MYSKIAKKDTLKNELSTNISSYFTVLYKREKIGKQIKYGVLIPCIREEKTIGNVLSKLMGLFGDNMLTIVIVNNKDDPTVYKAIENNVDVILKVNKKGYGAAIKSGLFYLHENFEDDSLVVIIIDGDDTYDLSKFNHNLTNYDRSTLYIGKRILTKKSMKTLNRIGNSILNYLFRLFFFRRISDSQSGLKIFPLWLYKYLKEDEMAFSTEIVIKSIDHSLKIKEIPIKYLPRVEDSESKLNPFKDGGKILFYFFKEGLKHRLGVGIFSFFISEFLLYFTFILLNYSLLISTLISGEISIILGYLMEIIFFYNQRENNNFSIFFILFDFIRYNIIFFPALSFSVDLILLTYYIFGIHVLVSNLIFSILMFPLNYELYTYFKHGKRG